MPHPTAALLIPLANHSRIGQTYSARFGLEHASRGDQKAATALVPHSPPNEHA